MSCFSAESETDEYEFYLWARWCRCRMDPRGWFRSSKNEKGMFVQGGKDGEMNYICVSVMKDGVVQQFESEQERRFIEQDQVVLLLVSATTNQRGDVHYDITKHLDPTQETDCKSNCALCSTRATRAQIGQRYRNRKKSKQGKQTSPTSQWECFFEEEIKRKTAGKEDELHCHYILFADVQRRCRPCLLGPLILQSRVTEADRGKKRVLDEGESPDQVLMDSCGTNRFEGTAQLAYRAVQEKLRWLLEREAAATLTAPVDVFAEQPAKRLRTYGSQSQPSPFPRRPDAEQLVQYPGPSSKAINSRQSATPFTSTPTHHASARVSPPEQAPRPTNGVSVTCPVGQYEDSQRFVPFANRIPTSHDVYTFGDVAATSTGLPPLAHNQAPTQTELATTAYDIESPSVPAAAPPDSDSDTHSVLPAAEYPNDRSLSPSFLLSLCSANRVAAPSSVVGPDVEAADDSVFALDLNVINPSVDTSTGPSTERSLSTDTSTGDLNEPPSAQALHSRRGSICLSQSQNAEDTLRWLNSQPSQSQKVEPVALLKAEEEKVDVLASQDCLFAFGPVVGPIAIAVPLKEKDSDFVQVSIPRSIPFMKELLAVVTNLSKSHAFDAIKVLDLDVEKATTEENATILDYYLSELQSKNMEWKLGRLAGQVKLERKGGAKPEAKAVSGMPMQGVEAEMLAWISQSQ